MDWATHDHRRPAPTDTPAAELLQVFWRVIGVSETSRPITCALYAGPAGRFEVRAEYSPDDLIRSELVHRREDAADTAATWKLAALEKGFTEFTEH